MSATLTLQLSLDLYLPSMPAMQNYFATTHNMIQYTLLIYLIGTGFFQLFYGPIIDHFGRRTITIIAMMVFFLASLGCIKTHNIYWFLLWRFIQGAADGAVYVVYRATLRDLFGNGSNLTKVISYASMAWIMIPILAPFFGGYVQHYYGWRMNFIIPFVLSAFSLLLLWRFLPETKPAITDNVIIKKNMLKKYCDVIQQPIFILAILSVMLVNSMMLCYNLISPFLLQDTLHLSAIEFGWSAMFVATGYILGSFINGKMINKVSRVKFILFAITLVLIGVLLLALLATLYINSVLAIITPVFIIFFGLGIIYPSLTAIALQPFKHNIGVASALQGTVQTGFAVIISFSATLIPHHTALPLALLFLVFSILILIIFIRIKYNNHSILT
jgi:DHA1 family 2-module integral membrane pump EmrD-like MFS transporter